MVWYHLVPFSQTLLFLRRGAVLIVGKAFLVVHFQVNNTIKIYQLSFKPLKISFKLFFGILRLHCIAFLPCDTSCCFSLQINRSIDDHFQKAHALPVAVFSSGYGGTLTLTVNCSITVKMKY